MDRFTTFDGKIVGFNGDMDKLAEALLRLSEYENTGLLPGEVAAMREEVERQKFDTYCLMIALKGESAVLKAKSEKAKEEILALKKQIECLLAKKQEASNMDRFFDDRPVSDSKLTSKKIAWEAD